jgi:hypothetical protein
MSAGLSAPTVQRGLDGSRDDGLGLIWILGIVKPGQRTPTRKFPCQTGSPPTTEKYMLSFGFQNDGNEQELKGKCKIRK